MRTFPDYPAAHLNPILITARSNAGQGGEDTGFVSRLFNSSSVSLKENFTLIFVEITM